MIVIVVIASYEWIGDGDRPERRLRGKMVDSPAAAIVND